MASLKQKIEALLFVAGKPVAYKELAKFTKVMTPQVRDVILELEQEYAKEQRGMQIVVHDKDVQLVSHGDTQGVTQAYLREDIEGNLSRAALETLAIISYRQPITRPEIDFIRGVNSSIMLRNLLMRGLIDRRRSKNDARMFDYVLSLDFIKMLGISKVQDLPDYQDLVQSEAMKTLDKAYKEATAAKEGGKAELSEEEKKTMKDSTNNKEYTIPINVVKKDSPE